MNAGGVVHNCGNLLNAPGTLSSLLASLSSEVFCLYMMPKKAFGVLLLPSVTSTNAKWMSNNNTKRQSTGSHESIS